MKKMMGISAATLCLTFGLAGCHSTMNDVSQFGNKTVGAGVKYTAQTVGAGAHVLANTGAVVGHGVGKVVDTGARVVTYPMRH